MSKTRIFGISLIGLIGAVLVMYLEYIAGVKGVGWYILGFFGGSFIAITLWSLAVGKGG